MTKPTRCYTEGYTQWHLAPGTVKHHKSKKGSLNLLACMYPPGPPLTKFNKRRGEGLHLRLMFNTHKIPTFFRIPKKSVFSHWQYYLSSEKLRAPDGILTHDPPCSSHKIDPCSPQSSRSSVVRASDQNTEGCGFKSHLRFGSFPSFSLSLISCIYYFVLNILLKSGIKNLFVFHRPKKIFLATTTTSLLAPCLNLIYKRFKYKKKSVEL